MLPNLLILDCVGSNKWTPHAPGFGHMTPELLKPGLIEFRRHKGYLPPVVLLHMLPTPDEEKSIKESAEKMSEELNVKVEAGYEGMEIEI